MIFEILRQIMRQRINLIFLDGGEKGKTINLIIDEETDDSFVHKSSQISE
jgi:hypothetical protein